MSGKAVAALILCITSSAFAEDFETVTGKQYKDATITRLEPDGIIVRTKSGITKVYFAELPKEMQERFHYDPQQAHAYSAEQGANYTLYQNQQAEAQHQQADAAARNQALLAEQQAAANRVQALRQRYTALQQQEDSILASIGEAKKNGPAYWSGNKTQTLHHYPNPKASELPLLESHLSEVRREKNEVRKQLEKTQR
jgi:hypothetical protein